jgi:predicted MPP superfamily phosphohydrolase
VLFVLASGWTPWSLWVAAGALLFTIALLATFLRNRGWPFYPTAAFRLFVVRPFWYLQLMLPIVSGAGLLGLVIGLLFRAPLATGRVFASVAFSAFALFLLAGYFGSRRLRVRHVLASIPELPQSFDGFTIAQISDLHVGPHLSKRFLARAVRITQELNADAIAVTGDLIDDRWEDVAEYARWFGSLHAPSGVFAIPGNHEIYSGWAQVDAALRRLDGVELLVNQSRVITRGADSIAIAGTGDPAARNSLFPYSADSAAPDIPRTLASIPPGMTVIALAHNPALWPLLAARGVTLTLSGHTHWGQLAIPRIAWSAASPFLEHAMGAYTENGCLLYIHPGTGYWGLPFRLGATAEVALITLKRGASGIEIRERPAV